MGGTRDALPIQILSLPPANEVCEGYVFTGVCLSTKGGACVVARGGHAWLLQGGGACVVARGGMHGCSGGACVVARGACVVAPGGVRGSSGGGCVVFSMRYGQ